MNPITHDPREYIRGLQQILISDTKKIGFLFGAGTSLAVKKGASNDSKIPAINEMTANILGNIKDKKYKSAFGKIEEEIKSENQDYNIENILSSIIQKEQAIGDGELCGIKKSDFQDLKLSIEKEIIKIVSVHKKKKSFIDNLVHCDFAQWINNAKRKFPVELFTTNYDYLFEMGLEYHNVQYFDGFIGSFEPFFDSQSIEDKEILKIWTKLWKIHGSLGWDLDKENHKVIKNFRKNIDKGKTEDEVYDPIIIFPSLLKYDNSKKQPYAAFLDRLQNFISANDTILITCGYSFNDQHINDVILRGLQRTNSSHVIGLLHGDIDAKSKVNEISRNETKLSIYSKRHAVIGGMLGEWKLSNEPSADDITQINIYYDIDSTPAGSTWTGLGNFKLGDFTYLVEFLSFLNYEIHKNTI